MSRRPGRRNIAAERIAMEPVTRRLRRCFGLQIVLQAKANLNYGEEEGLEDRPRRWDYEKLQEECRRIMRQGVG